RGGGGDRVGGGVDVLGAEVVDDDLVLDEGGGLELHRAFSPGVVRAGVDAGGVRLAVVALDCADPGEHGPGQARAGRGCAHVEGEVGRGDAVQGFEAGAAGQASAGLAGCWIGGDEEE